MMSNNMLETRQKNIERNAKFMESLGLTKPNTTEQQTQNKDLTVAFAGEKNGLATSLSNCDKNTREDVYRKFPYRRSHIDYICRYLDMEIVPSPPLLLSGSGGCGKYSISSNIILQQQNDNHHQQRPSQLKPIICIISCKGYTDDKFFFVELWSQIILSVKQQLIFSATISSSSFSSVLFNDIDKIRPPRSFTEFSNTLAPLLNDINKHCLLDANSNSNRNININNNNNSSSHNSTIAAIDTISTSHPFKVCFLFQNIDRLDYLEKSLASKLLQLSQLCYPGIRVIATTSITSSYSASFVHQQCLVLHFAPYTSIQINAILKQHIQQTFVISDSRANNNTTHNATSTTHNNDNINNNNACTSSSAATTVVSSDQRFLQFCAFLDQSVEIFLVYTTHISLLCEMIQSAWIIYRSKSGSTSNSNRSSKQRVDNNQNASSSSKSITKQALPLATISRTLCNDSVRQILNIGSGMRFYTIDDDIILPPSTNDAYNNNNNNNNTAVIKFGKRRECPPESLLKVTANTSAVTNNFHNNSAAVDSMSSSSSSSLSLIAPSVAAATTTATTTTLSSTRWLTAMPLSTKYLILAAFIAGRNNKQSDAHIFGVSTRGKRKKSRKENNVNNKKLHKYNNNDDENDNSNHNNNNNNDVDDDYSSNSSTSTFRKTVLSTTTNYTTLRTFTLERVFGIFGQIACYCGIKNLNDGERASLSLGGGEVNTNDDNIGIHMEVGEISRQYGTARLFAVVKSLVNQKLLFLATSSDPLKDSCYQCNVPRSIAEMIAKSVRFPLRDFIHEDD